MKLIDDLLEGQHLPVPVDQFKLGIVLVLNLPFAWLIRTHRNPNLKHRVCWIVGLLNLFFLYETSSVIFSALLNTFFYFTIKRFPQRYRELIVGAFGYLVGMHIYRLITDYLSWKIDFTTHQMMASVKLMAFAFNVHDGLAKPEHLTPHALHHRILPQAFPSFEVFLSHMYFFPGLCTGPIQDFKDHCDFITFERFATVGHKVPAEYLPILISVSRMLFFGFVSINSPFDTAYYRTLIYKTELSLFSRFVRTFVLTVSSRTRYYLGWTMAETVGVFSGVHARVDEKTNTVVWDHFCNFGYFGIEFGNSLKTVVDNWNTSIQRWLRHYVYERLPFTQFRAECTLLVSAFWHGFYPSYYFAFGILGFQRHVANLARKKMRPRFLSVMSQFKYDILTTIATMVSMINCNLFLLLSLQDTLQALYYIMWLYNIPCIIWWIILLCIPYPRKAVNAFQPKTRRNEE